MEPILIVSSALLWMVVLFNLFLTFALVRRINTSVHDHSSPLNESLVGQKAPDFKAETLSGKEVTQNNYRGRKVAFLFIGPDCPPCIENLPDYHALIPKATSAGVELVLVSIGDKDRTQNFVKQHNIRLPVLVAPLSENSFMSDYKVFGTPAFIFVDENGIIQFDGYPGKQSEPWKKLTGTWT